jgi:hypothetical protein
VQGLPDGTVVIESVDVYAFAEMVTYLFVWAESPSGGAFTGQGRITLPLSTLPNSTDTSAHTAGSVTINDGGLAGADPGELTRDETHPVRMCVRDATASSAINSLWTISGRVLP